MSEITFFGATPNRLAVLYRCLANENEKAQKRENLAALIAPQSLANNDADVEFAAFVDCLTVGKRIGLFSEESGVVRLTDPSSAKVVANSFEDELAKRLVDSAKSASNDAVAGVIAWMLCQDPLTPLKWSGSSSVMLLRRQFREEIETDFGMSNDSTFQQAVYWGRALGFVSRLKLNEEVVIPDPTEAIERRLKGILPLGKDILLRTFLSDLAKCCPVFEGGCVRSEVEGWMRPEFIKWNEGSVSSSTALGLQRLQLRGTIDLKRLDDGQVIFVNGMLNDGRVSHISRN